MRIFPENFNVSSWRVLTSSGILGTSLLLGSFWYPEVVTLNYAFLGFLMLTGSVVGLSNYLSTLAKKEDYHLGSQIKKFMLTHKIMTLCASLGLTMLNPYVMATGLFLGLWIERSAPSWVDFIDSKSLALFNYLNKRSFSEHLNFLKAYVEKVIKDEPGKFASFVIGSCIALALFAYAWPWLAIPAYYLNVINYGLLTTLADWTVNAFSGGTVPYLLLQNLALSLDAFITLTPVVALAGASIWAVEKSRLLGKEVLQLSITPLIAKPKAVWQDFRRSLGRWDKNLHVTDVDSDSSSSSLLADQHSSDSKVPEVTDQQSSILYAFNADSFSITVPENLDNTPKNTEENKTQPKCF